jgi:hypothetical protein
MTSLHFRVRPARPHRPVPGRNAAIANQEGAGQAEAEAAAVLRAGRLGSGGLCPFFLIKDWPNNASKAQLPLLMKLIDRRSAWVIVPAGTEPCPEVALRAWLARATGGHLLRGAGCGAGIMASGAHQSSQGQQAV